VALRSRLYISAHASLAAEFNTNDIGLTELIARVWTA
jgi:hypothetical protein